MKFPALLLSACLGVSTAALAALSNEDYRVEITEGGAISVINLAGGNGIFRPQFVVIQTPADPKYSMRYLDIPGVRYHAASWLTDKKSSSLGKTNTEVEGGDGFVAETQKAETQGRTVDVFQSGSLTRLEAAGAVEKDGKIEWTFAKNPAFQFSASVELPAGHGEPRLTYSFKPSQEGWYSVGYTGAPAVSLEDADEIWQPLIWQQKRFPAESVLTPAGYCTLPATFAVRGGIATGVAADPSEMPFMPLPSWSNSSFGVAIRDEAGQARPMIFSPLLGGPKSQMKSGDQHAFQARLFVGQGTCVQAYERMARSLYGFHDYRENVAVSLNRTIENMIDYGMSDFSRFDANLKGCMYETDVPGAVKNVSSLHPLEVAVLTDDKAIYDQRALPILEYLISREKFLFVLDKNVKTQAPSRLMLGPCAESSEFAAAYAFGGGQSPILLQFANELAAKKLNAKTADGWVQQLALYHSLGDPKLLEQAISGADAYIARRLAKAEDGFDPTEAGNFFFWTSYAPLWINLLDLYEVTKEPRFLKAAHQGAREFTQFVMMSPRIPEGNVTVNPGGKAPQYSYLKNKTTGPMTVPEETIPAWRVSEIGLTAESSSTVISHRGIFMVNFAAWMMRLSELAGDQFLHDVARSAVVGRYQNFPGYHINTERTTVYEKADYPYHAHKELSYNSFHYNHPWPMITLLIDYLVNDVFAKSKGKIVFPARYSQGYGYLQSRIYGDRPGDFYEEKNVRLWMPKGLLEIENPQMNYLAGRRGGTLFAALANQSSREEKTTLTINPELVQFPADQSIKVKVWRNNQPAEPLEIKNGRLEVSVPASGITALMIEGGEIKSGFQEQFGKPADQAATPNPVTIPTGDARAMILSFGPGLSNAYIYLRETDDTLASATLRYREGDAWKNVTDDKYPFEFSIPVRSDSKNFEFILETTDHEGKVSKSDSTAIPLVPPTLTKSLHH